MAFQPVPGTAAIAVHQLIADGNIQVVNTFYGRRIIGAWNEALLAGIAEEVKLAWANGVRAYQAPNITTTQIVARDLSVEFGAQAISPVNAAGSNNDEPIPWQCAGLVRLIGAAAAAPRRGRIFIAGLTNQNVLRGELTAQMKGLLDVGVQGVLNAIADTDVEPVIVSRRQGGALRPVAATNNVVSVDTRLVLGSQRDRRND